MLMKKIPFLSLAIIFSLVVIPLSGAQEAPQVMQEAPQAMQETPQAMQEPGQEIFHVNRFVVAGSVENLEPVGIVDAFAASTEKVYCFLEATRIKEDTTVRFVWYHGETKTAEIDLTLRKGPRWRTYSSKQLGGRTGDWRVELQNADGKVLEVIGFTVE